jgi:hypothetical protein
MTQQLLSRECPVVDAADEQRTKNETRGSRDRLGHLKHPHLEAQYNPIKALCLYQFAIRGQYWLFKVLPRLTMGAKVD